MKTLTDNAAESIGVVFRTFFGDRDLVTFKGAEPNERHIGALVDLTRPESVSAAARIEADCRKALAEIDVELAKLTTELEGTQAALRRTESHIGELRDEISRVALKSPVKAKELASSREMEEHRQAALVRLVGETQDLLGAAQAKRHAVVDAAIEAERALWDAEISQHVDAIERLAAELYNRREAILRARTARYVCYNRLKGLLPRTPQEPEPPVSLALSGSDWGIGLGEAVGETIRRQGGGDDDEF